MKLFLSLTNRKVDKVLGDGNCLFRALAKQLTGTSEEHVELRKLLMRFEEINYPKFTATLAPPITFAEHIKSRKQDRCWETTVEIFAAATLFNIDIYEATDSLVPGTPRWMKFRNYSTIKGVERAFFNTLNVQWIEILYTNNCHYDSIISADGKYLSCPPLAPTETHITLITWLCIYLRFIWLFSSHTWFDRACAIVSR